MGAQNGTGAWYETVAFGLPEKVILLRSIWLIYMANIVGAELNSTNRTESATGAKGKPLLRPVLQFHSNVLPAVVHEFRGFAYQN